MNSKCSINACPIQLSNWLMSTFLMFKEHLGLYIDYLTILILKNLEVHAVAYKDFCQRQTFITLLLIMFPLLMNCLLLLFIYVLNSIEASHVNCQKYNSPQLISKKRIKHCFFRIKNDLWLIN